jgi:hypothetical protein
VDEEEGGSRRGTTCGRAAVVIGPTATSAEAVGDVEHGKHVHEDRVRYGGDWRVGHGLAVVGRWL